MTTGTEDRSPAAALIEAIRAHDPAALDAAIATASVTPGAVDEIFDGTSPLRDAIVEGWIEAVERLLEAGADPSRAPKPALRPLVLSISFGEYGIASRLMRSPGFDLAAQGYRAAYAAMMSRDPEGLRCLAEHGFDLHAPAPPEAGEMGSLDVATALLFNSVSIGLPNAAVFEYLLAEGADPAAAVVDHTLPISLCRRVNEAPEVLRLLLEAGAPCDRPDGAGYAPLHHAAANDQVESVGLLLDHGARPAGLASDGTVPLLWAAADGRGRSRSALLDRHDDADLVAIAAAMDRLAAHWRWTPGDATWGALASAPNGAWHGLAWADGEEAVMAALQETFWSVRGQGPPCLLVRLCDHPGTALAPSPWLEPGREATIRTGDAMALGAFAPALPGGIRRSFPPDPTYRFVLRPNGGGEGSGAEQPPTRWVAVEVARIVSFYEGWCESLPSVRCGREGDDWTVTPVASG